MKRIGLNNACLKVRLPLVLKTCDIYTRSTYLALEELEHQEQATKAIQSLYDESDEKVDEIESRLLCGTWLL
jgi:hypothetical protein